MANPKTPSGLPSASDRICPFQYIGTVSAYIELYLNWCFAHRDQTYIISQETGLDMKISLCVSKSDELVFSIYGKDWVQEEAQEFERFTRALHKQYFTEEQSTSTGDSNQECLR